MILVVDPAGQVHCLYDECIDLAALGTPVIRRGSHVEPDQHGRWWADLAPVGGPMLGPCELRSEALDAERAWLESHWLMTAEKGAPLKTATMTLDVKFDPTTTDAEALASALDSLLETALSTPGILDEYGPVGVGAFYVRETTPVKKPAKPEIVIVVEGGVVQDVYATTALDVTLIDHDEAEFGDVDAEEISVREEQAVQRCPHHVF